MSFDLSKLGVSKNIPKISFTSYTGLLAAPPKFGKSTISSKFPNSIIVPFEEGTKGLVANVVDGMSTWEDFIAFVDKLEANRAEIGDAVQTIVFDTITEAYNLLEPYTLKYCSRIDGERYKTVADMQGAKSNFWIERDKLLKKQIDRILRMKFTILFITHLKVKTVRPKKGEPYDVYSTTMSDRLEALINPLVDFIITGEERLIEDDNGNKTKKRVLVTKTNEMSEDVGHRVHIGQDIVFDTEVEAMEKFQELFRQSVERKIRESGVFEDMDVLEKRQQEERKEQIKKFVEEKESTLSVEDAKKFLQAQLPTAPKTKLDALKSALKSTLGTIDFKTSDDQEQLNQAVLKVKEILGLEQ